MVSIARVYVNQVEVGSVPEGQYKSIVAASHRNWRLYVLQFFNILTTAYRFLVKTLQFVPVVWFVVFIWVLVIDPSEMTAFVTKLSELSPEQITSALRRAFDMGLMTAVFFQGVALAISGKASSIFSFHNAFDSDINYRLRKILEVPAEGDLTVLIVDNGDQTNG